MHIPKKFLISDASVVTLLVRSYVLELIINHSCFPFCKSTSMAMASSSSFTTRFPDLKPMATVGDNHRCLRQDFAPFLKSNSNFSSSFSSLSTIRKLPRKRFQGKVLNSKFALSCLDFWISPQFVLV